MLLNIRKKYFYLLFIIISGILITSCAENLNGVVGIKNRSYYYNIIDLEVGDTSFYTVKPRQTTSYKSFMPGTYKIKGIIDLTNDAYKDIKFEKTFQINASRQYTIIIRNEKRDDVYIVIKEGYIY